MKTIFRALISILLSSPVFADELHIEARLLCEGYEAIIQVARRFNEPPVFGTLPQTYLDRFATTQTTLGTDCNIGTDDRPRQLRVKFGSYPGQHFGACGGATRHFFSMWIDQRLILSRRIFNNPCSQFEDLDLVYYSNSKLVFCAGSNRISHPSDGFSETDNTDHTCIDVSHIYSDAIRGPIDEIEYPTDGMPRREGHVILLHSENPELCAYLHTEFQAGKGFYNVFDRYNEESGTSGLVWPLGPYGPIGPFSLDVNNDGLPDVLAVGQYGPGSIGEELILLADGREGQGISNFPEQMTSKQIADFPALIPVGETIFAEGLGEAKKPFTLLRPFDWGGTTFVLYGSVYDRRPPEWAVYRVDQDNTFSETCVLDRVPIHY